jgi:hypothetical protein
LPLSFSGPGLHLHRRAVPRQPPDRGQEVAIGVLGVKPAFDGPAGQRDVVLRKRQLLARRHADHLLHQVDTGDQLRHRMFHLQARVHLEEVEVLLPVDDELHRPGAGIAHRLRQRAGLFAHRLARRGVEEGRRRLLDDLLVAPLDRAFPLAEVDAVAMAIGQHLDLDMARLGDEFLDEHAVVAETRRRLVLRRLEALAHLVLGPRDAHPLAAAARAGLQHHRVADLAGDRTASSASSIRPMCPGTVETPASAAIFFDVILSPIASIAPAGGPMKATPRPPAPRRTSGSPTGTRSPDAPPPRPWP